MNNSVFNQEGFRRTFNKFYGESEIEKQQKNFDPIPIMSEVYEPTLENGMRKRDVKAETKKLVKPEMPLQGPARGGRTP
jgi:hypothetical protein